MPLLRAFPLKLKFCNGGGVQCPQQIVKKFDDTISLFFTTQLDMTERNAKTISRDKIEVIHRGMGWLVWLIRQGSSSRRVRERRALRRRRRCSRHGRLFAVPDVCQSTETDVRSTPLRTRRPTCEFVRAHLCRQLVREADEHGQVQNTERRCASSSPCWLSASAYRPTFTIDTCIALLRIDRPTRNYDSTAIRLLIKCH